MINKGLHFVGIIFLVFLTLKTSVAQQQKRKNFDQKVKLTNELLQETNKEIAFSYNKLQLLNQKINNRVSYIAQMQDDIKWMEQQIAFKSDSIKSLSIELDELKKEYAKMIYFAWKTRNSYDKMIFVLSAKDFNQSYRRLKYLQQYADYRKKQAEKLLKVKRKLNLQVVSLTNAVTIKQKTSENLQRETQVMMQDRVDLSGMLQKMKNEEKKLMEDYQKNNRNVSELETNVLKFINQSVYTTKNIDQTKKIAQKALTGHEKRLGRKLDLLNIANNKGILPWPVEEGIVFNYYGDHPHPILTNVKLRNNGIDISTRKGATVRAVFRGTVSKVIMIPGGSHAVLLSHGNDFYTLYANLSVVLVKPGDLVEIKEKIGVVLTDEMEDNRTTLKFQLWYNTQTIDPLTWLFEK